MESKHIAWIICVIVICIAAGVTISTVLVPAPQFTDPVAQRIWAATHGNISLDGQEAAKLVKSATFADSVRNKP